MREPLLAREHQHRPQTQRDRYFGPSVAAALFLSALLLFILLLAPLDYPFSGSLDRTLLSALYFISNVISLFYYIAQTKKRWDENKERPDPSKRIWLRVSFISLFIGIAAGITIVALILKRVIAPGETSILPVTTGSIINGILFICFMGGLFLSLACRLNPENKSSTEFRSILYTFLLCFTLVLLVASLPFSGVSLGFMLELGSFNQYTLLGANVFIGILASLIATASSLAKAYDWYQSLNSDRARALPVNPSPSSVQARLWEHRFTVLGLVLGSIICVCILALKLYPFGDYWLNIIGACTMAIAACASLWSKIGRSIDETMVTPRPVNSWLTWIVIHASSIASGIRFFLAAGLFATLGFSLYWLSPLAQAGGALVPSWGIDLHALAFSLAAFSVVCIANWTSLLKPSITSTPPYQTLNSQQQIQALLAEMRRDNEQNPLWADALLTLLKPVREVFNEEWRESIIPALGEDTPVNADRAGELLDSILTSNADKTTLLWENQVELQNLFARLNVDSSYQPPFPEDRTMPVALVSILSFSTTIILLFLMLGEVIGLSAMAWAIPLTLVFATLALVATRYLLTKTTNAYPTGAILAGMATLIAIVLSCFSIFGVPFLGFSLDLVKGPFITTAVVCLVVLAWILNKANTSEQISEERQRGAKRTLTRLKILFALVFLIAAFLSTAALFNLSWYSSLGLPGYAAGGEKLGLFAIGFFAITSFISFQLFKNLLTLSPKDRIEVRANEHVTAWATLVFKILFIALPIIALSMKPSAFLNGPEAAMLPLFLIFMVLTPCFVSDIDFPFKSPKAINLAKLFNTYFGTQQLKDQNGKPLPDKLLLREIRILLILIVPAIVIAAVTGVAATAAAPLIAIATITTLFFRGGIILVQTHDPVKLAKDLIKENVARRQLEIAQLAPNNEQDIAVAAIPPSSSNEFGSGEFNLGFPPAHGEEHKEEHKGEHEEENDERYEEQHEGDYNEQQYEEDHEGDHNEQYEGEYDEQYEEEEEAVIAPAAIPPAGIPYSPSNEDDSAAIDSDPSPPSDNKGHIAPIYAPLVANMLPSSSNELGSGEFPNLRVSVSNLSADSKNSDPSPSPEHKPPPSLAASRVRLNLSSANLSGHNNPANPPDGNRDENHSDDGFSPSSSASGSPP